MVRRKVISVPMTEGGEVPVPVDHETFGEVASEVDATLREAEDEFRSLGLKAVACVDLSRTQHGPEGDEWPEDAAAYTHTTRLLFRKRAGRWQLHVDSGVEGDPETWSEADLWSQSVDTKLLAIRALPKLFEQMCEQRKDKLLEMKATVDEGRKFIAAIRKGRTDA